MRRDVKLRWKLVSTFRYRQLLFRYLPDLVYFISATFICSYTPQMSIDICEDLGQGCHDKTEVEAKKAGASSFRETHTCA